MSSDCIVLAFFSSSLLLLFNQKKKKAIKVKYCTDCKNMSRAQRGPVGWPRFRVQRSERAMQPVGFLLRPEQGERGTGLVLPRARDTRLSSVKSAEETTLIMNTGRQAAGLAVGQV